MITSFFEDFMSKIYIPSISVIDIIEIAIISFLTFRIILWLRSTKAWSMLKGVAVIIIFIFIAYRTHRLRYPASAGNPKSPGETWCQVL